MKIGPWIKTIGIISLMVGYPLGMHWLLTASEWSHATLAWLNLAQMVGMQSLLAWFFGRTLRAGREPLIAQFARRFHRPEDYTPRIAHYARQSTWAWTWFFVSMVIIPLVLFFTASLSTWSFFVNVLSLPLLGAMFVGEYAARRWCLRGTRQVSLFQGIAAYREHRSTSDDQS